MFNLAGGNETLFEELLDFTNVISLWVYTSTGKHVVRYIMSQVVLIIVQKLICIANRRNASKMFQILLII